jgi:integral membrane protein
MEGVSSTVKIFRVVAVAEAITWFVLIVAMVVKRVFDEPDAIKYPGWLHGVAFIAYLAVVVMTARKLGWHRTMVETRLPRTSGAIKIPLVLWALFASLPPFGTIVFDWWAEKRGHLHGTDTSKAATS